MTINYNALARDIFEQNKAMGWWDDMDRCIYQCLQLVITEIAEATEGERKNLMDDHLPHRKMGEVELADAMIRMLDLGGRYGWEYEADDHMFEMILGSYNSFLALPIGGKHFLLSAMVSALGTDYKHQRQSRIETFYSAFLYLVAKTAQFQGYDLEGAIHEKLAYNRTRHDHSREARAAEGGKAFKESKQ